MKRALTVGLWFIITPLTLFASFYLAQQITKTRNFSVAVKSSLNYIASQENPYKMFAALPGQIGGVVQAIEANDARVFIVENFFEIYNSPLVPYSRLLVDTADKYGLDFRLLPAIAMKESGGGKAMPDNSHNAWGWAIHETYTKKFVSWEEGVETVAKSLRQDYLDQGLVTPEQIMTKYTPASISKGGPWARDIRDYLAQME